MKQDYITYLNQKNLISGVILRKLIIHEDESGLLVETLRSDWSDVFDDSGFKFAMQYFSVTPSGFIRDQDRWHVHKIQYDRFICISGRIVAAIYDPRKNSKTEGILTLFLMGPKKDEEMYMLVIPKETLHGFMVISKEPGYLLNFPTQLYTGKDEGRIDNTHLNWQEIKNDFGLWE